MLLNPLTLMPSNLISVNDAGYVRSYLVIAVEHMQCGWAKLKEAVLLVSF